MLNKTFSNLSVDLIKVLYPTYVRPHLKFAVSACFPYSKHDTELLEKVQHRATRLVPELRELEKEQQLDRLGITTLELRRIRGDLIQTYKFLNGIDKVTSEQKFTVKSRDVIIIIIIIGQAC